MINREKKFEVKGKIKPIKVFLFIFSLVMFLGCCFYTYLKIADINEVIDKTYTLIDSVIMLLFAFILFFTLIFNKNILKFLTSLVFIIYLSFNIFINLNVIKLPIEKIIGSKINENINEVIIWGKENNIEINYEYEYSDRIEVDKIMLQDVNKNELLKNVKKVNFIVSNGPNLDKTVAISNFAGSGIDDFLNFMNDNFLDNVEIIYQINEDIEKDIIISQSSTGNIKRNESIKLIVSLGNEEDLVPIKLDSLKNKSLFDATLYLKRNGLKYDVNYDFSAKVEKGKVISHNPNKEETVDPKTDTVLLIVSKGKEIKVPNLLNMTSDSIVKWVLDNNLKIKFEEDHSTKDIGNIIKSNYKENDIVSEGDTIIITTSKGPLKLETYNTLQEFTDWAEKYDVSYNVKNEYHNTIARGKIIKLSHSKGTIIEEGTEITIYVSSGKSVTTPNFVGKSKTSITNTCNTLGIKCIFYYSNYSNVSKDVATNQNVKSGTTIISGAVVNIGLSRGPAKTFNIFIQSDWFGTTADKTITTLKSKLGTACPGVTFTYQKKESDIGSAGMIHKDSPVKGGNFSCTQGKNYIIWVIS